MNHTDPPSEGQRIPFDHEEPLAVGRDIVVGRQTNPRTLVGALKKHPRLADLEIRLRAHRDSDHPVLLAVEELSPIGGPNRLIPSVRQYLEGETLADRLKKGAFPLEQALRCAMEISDAIKVLPSHIADNHDLRQRLEREARAVSSLNHPHICTLHD